ncbi:MAG TPA: hypothetical protein VK116_09055, partial [Planctomycetota bacterium]|nr:hypothetical protein [Planctomycetota bacterium]
MRTYAYAAFLAVAILAGLVAFFVLVILPDEGRNRVVSEGQGGSEQVEERPTTGPTRRGTPVRSAGTRTTSSEDDGETAHSDESSGTEIDALPIPSGGAILTIIVQEVDGTPVVDAPVSLRAGRAEEERITERDGSAVFAG